MGKIICYGFENNKLWFGRVTLWSWLMAFFVDGRFLKVKPIKGYEEYAYYPDCLMTLPGDCHIASNWLDRNNPITAIALAEKHSSRFTSKPIHPERKMRG